ncbi:MFS transporter [Paenibacillus sp. TRM 82003]|uniref:MFS transporter n=1 Tax=Kineococcus sp. TRM81007 TaxID=2925831 RepID=UPI001F5839DD|nr:MFS transporter [Kineococcus sp. TRM81007]MCI2237732.1 MFS transporter [Kineococcus sp. TRM81007]MCI3921750.1 MFS transporter [Paenibacillus sp. TRM 82003]
MSAPGPLQRARRSWYVYDWANSAYVTTTQTVLFAPYLTVLARRAACGPVTEGCTRTLSVLGVQVAPGSLALYTTTVATLLSALLLPFAGALADRVRRRNRLLGAFAWPGAAAGTAMVALGGDRWELGVLLAVVATLSLTASSVVNDALLCDVAEPAERDAVSSRGWAAGYLAGFLLLGLNLAVVSSPGALGLDDEGAVRVSLASAGLWWGVFTLVPVLGLRNLPPRAVPSDGGARTGGGRTGAVVAPLRQLVRTLRGLRGYPQALRFLLAYWVFNDGIQTVVAAASVYGQEELGFGSAQLITTVLIVQGVAFGGALAFGWAARRVGAQRAVLGGLGLWVLVVLAAFAVPRGAFGAWLALAVLIGLVLGGTQALARSMFSRLVPVGAEAEYFALYQAGERGTSWLGTLVFGLVAQLTGSYRPALVALLVFFVVGAWLLARVDVAAGARQAGQVEQVEQVAAEPS